MKKSNKEEIKEAKDILADLAKKNHELEAKEEARDIHLRRILNHFKYDMTEDAQLYILKELLSSLHYKSMIKDPDYMLEISNIKLRNFFFISACLFFVASIAYLGFYDTSYVKGFLSYVKVVIDLYKS